MEHGLVSWTALRSHSRADDVLRFSNPEMSFTPIVLVLVLNRVVLVAPYRNAWETQELSRSTSAGKTPEYEDDQSQPASLVLFQGSAVQ